VAIALIGWTGFSFVSLVAKGTYSFSYPVTVHDGQVNADINVGNVTLRQTAGNAARVTGSVQYGLLRPGLTENATAGITALGVNCDGINSNCDVNATLDVPARTAVMLTSDGGDIEASGFSSNLALSAAGGNMTASNLVGDLRLDTGGGNLTGSGLAGTIKISTEGGNVNVGNLDGPMRLDTGGGDLSGNGLTGDLQASTNGGNINLNAVDSRQVSVQSGGGDVTLTFSQPPTNLQITADGGNVNVIVPQGSTKYDISTPGSNGGNINYPSALANPTSGNIITVTSGGGDVTITQAS
jgi:DUF4097 and DUF4098 domain-containing protein YvlB